MGKRKAAEILTDSHRHINVLKFRYCKVSHFRGDTQMKKPPMHRTPKAACVIKTYRYKATLIEFNLFDISLSAKRNVLISSSVNCEGLPLTMLPLSFCASHERDLLK